MSGVYMDNRALDDTQGDIAAANKQMDAAVDQWLSKLQQGLADFKGDSGVNFSTVAQHLTQWVGDMGGNLTVGNTTLGFMQDAHNGADLTGANIFAS